MKERKKERKKGRKEGRQESWKGASNEGMR